MPILLFPRDWISGKFQKTNHISSVDGEISGQIKKTSDISKNMIKRYAKTIHIKKGGPRLVVPRWKLSQWLYWEKILLKRNNGRECQLLSCLVHRDRISCLDQRSSFTFSSTVSKILLSLFSRDRHWAHFWTQYTVLLSWRLSFHRIRGPVINISKMAAVILLQVKKRRWGKLLQQKTAKEKCTH